MTTVLFSWIGSFLGPVGLLTGIFGGLLLDQAFFTLFLQKDLQSFFNSGKSRFLPAKLRVKLLLMQWFISTENQGFLFIWDSYEKILKDQFWDQDNSTLISRIFLKPYYSIVYKTLVKKSSEKKYSFTWVGLSALPEVYEKYILDRILSFVGRQNSLNLVLLDSLAIFLQKSRLNPRCFKESLLSHELLSRDLGLAFGLERYPRPDILDKARNLCIYEQNDQMSAAYVLLEQEYLHIMELIDSYAEFFFSKE